MDCTIRRQPNGIQLSFSLPHQIHNPTVYPITATDGSTIILYGHENGLNTLKLHESGKADLSRRGSEDFEEEDTHPRLEQWVDIALDSPVTGIAVPFVRSNATTTPNFLQHNLLAVVACADFSVRLITFPLALNVQGKRRDITITALNGSECHQDLIASVAVSWMLDEDQDDQHKTRSSGHKVNLHFHVASASTTGGGLLTVHRLTLKSHLSGHEENDLVLVKQFVPWPLLGSTLVFNPETMESAKPPLLLLTSPAHGLVSILALHDNGPSSKRRRGEDTARTVDDIAGGLTLRTILTLYAPYHSTSIPASRKAILDAKWMTRGTGIVAIFEDGQWGMWDFQGSDRKSAWLGNETKAGTLSSFRILGNLSTASLQSKKGPGKSAADAITPVTPHTRKIRSAALFGNETAPPYAKLRQDGLSGQITLCDAQIANDTDDALILSYEKDNIYLPTLKPYLDANRSDNAAGGRSYEKRLQTLPPIRLGGERQLCIYNRSMSQEKDSTALLGAMNTKPNLLVVTNSRLILHNNTNHRSTLDSSALTLPLRTFHSRESTFMSRMTSDDILDVDAMDQILESMEQTENNDNALSPSRGTSTAIRTDEHLTSSRISSGSKLMIDGQRSISQRKLFG